MIGSACASLESKELADAADYQNQVNRSIRGQEQKRKALEARIAALRAEFD